MCGTIAIFFVGLIAIMMYIGGMVLALTVVFLFLFLASINRYKNSYKIQPTEMKCRNCGSNNVMINSVVDGTSSSNTVNHAFGMIFHSGQTKYNRKRVYRCSDCGFEDDYIMPEDIQKERMDAKNGVYIFGGLLIIFAYLSISMFWNGIEESPRRDKFETFDKTGSVWSERPTSLTEFDYDVNEDGTVTIYSYNGKADAIKINDKYTVDGEITHVSALDGTFTSNKTVKSVAIPPGVEYIGGTTFDDSEIQYLYLPATLKMFGGWNHLADIKKIYYGGSEEEWNLICLIDMEKYGIEVLPSKNYYTLK